jgi:purine nucleoside phosphorylase
MKVAGLSLMTNYAAGMTSEPLGHLQTMAVAREAAGRVRLLLRRFLEGYC